MAINNNLGSAYIFGSQRLDLYANGINTVSLNTGNVGIGTTTPTAKLDIVGNTIVSGTVTAPTFVGNATTATNLSTSRANWNTNGTQSAVV